MFRLGLILLLFACGRAAETPDNAVPLPPFIVEEASKGPPWRYTVAPPYEVLSRCNDGITRNVVEAHDRLHQLLAEILPPSLQLELSVPRTLILYDEELQPAASREVIARLLRPPPEIPPVEIDLPGAGRALRTVAPPRPVSFLPNLRLQDRDVMAVFMIVRRDRFEADRLALTPDYVSTLVKHRLPSLPPWFIAGFMSLYRQITYTGSALEAAPLEWPGPVPPLPAADAPADPAAPPVLFPLAHLFGAQLPAREKAPFEPVAWWQAQAALFVRWGLDPAGGADRKQAFWKFTERAAVEGGDETVFRACFGRDYAAVQAELRAFLPVATRKTARYKPAKFAKLPPLAFSNATDGQLGRIKGDWERLEVPYVRQISPDLAEKYLEQARRTLRRAYDRGAREPGLLAVLGLTEVDAGNDAGAREWLESAANLGDLRPRAWYELARLRFAAAKAAPDGTDGRLGVNQAADVLRPLFNARRHTPPLPEVYDLIAEVWATGAARPNRGHLAVLDEGVRLFPRRLPLIYRAAELNLLYGFHDHAASLVAIGRRQTTSDETWREQFAALAAKLPPAAAAAAAELQVER